MTIGRHIGILMAAAVTTGSAAFAQTAPAGAPSQEVASAGGEAPQAKSRPAGTVAPSAGPEELAKIEARRRELFALMLADPSNLDVAFEYAGLSSRAGDLEAAISTLERMLIFAPGLPRLQLELGVLYYRLGAFGTARAYLAEAVAAPNVPDVVKARVDPYLAAIDDKSAGSRLVGAVTTGVRYQTNANAAPEIRTISTTFGELLLDPGSLGEDDVNGFASASLNYAVDMPGQGDRFEVSFDGYAAIYDEHREIDTFLAELTAGPVFDMERFGLSDTAIGAYAILGGVSLGGDPYQGSVGAGASLARLIGQHTRLVSQYEIRFEEYEDSDERPRASDRSGERFRSSTRLQHQFTERFGIFAALATDRRFAEREYLSYLELGGSAGASLAFNSPFPKQEEPWNFAVVAGYANRDYDVADPVFSLDEEEEDDEIFVTGTLSVPVRDDWYIQGQGGYRTVDSNYDLRTFDNAYGSLAVQKRF